MKKALLITAAAMVALGGCYIFQSNQYFGKRVLH
jgi:hypothetical protein